MNESKKPKNNVLEMKIPPLILALILSFFYFHLLAQPQRGDCRILFYNVENLFDVINDTLINDEEFLPGKGRNWNRFKFDDKINKIAKVIIAAGGWEAPEIVGLCEVENRYVVEQLIKKTPLHSFGYNIIHKESPDLRGIDVSMLYKKDRFKPLKYRYLEVKNSNGQKLNSREILYVEGILKNKDTLHFFFNHWPSRYSGYLETAGLRKQAAKTLRKEVDLIFQKNPDSKIIIMGDFNDQPSDESIVNELKAVAYNQETKNGTLYNLSAAWNSIDSGTIKYQAQWLIYDQVIVSKGLLNNSNSIYSTPLSAGIFVNDFLLKRDDTHGGFKPFRTYSGFSYEGGFSDHLPIFLDLFIN
ncbi:MAG: endonuclease [Mariniphaga sp.]|nr:endonuclease [Mariniphaga sp.]